MIELLKMTINKQKNIALIAHDGKKQDMIRWSHNNKETLKKHRLSGTGTTARMITDQVGLSVKGYNSGPLGGDQQIGAKIVEGSIDIVIFFSDPLAAQPHDPDVKALYDNYFEQPLSHKSHMLLHTDHNKWQMPPSPQRNRNGYVINPNAKIQG